MKTKSDFETGDEIRIYKERRKAIQARYYQRHRRIIKLAIDTRHPDEGCAHNPRARNL